MTSITMAAPRRSVRVRVREVAGPIHRLSHPRGLLPWMIVGTSSHGPTQFLSAAVFGLQTRRHLRARRARLHPRLRHHRADQLRPRRPVHARNAAQRDHHQPLVLDARRRAGLGRSCASPWSRAWRSAPPSTSCIELFAYRRLRHAPKLAPLITAVGFSFILQNVGQRLERLGAEELEHGVPPGRPGSCTGSRSRPSRDHRLAATIPLLLLHELDRGQDPAGPRMRATAQDIDAARLMGINVNRTISFTFALGGALAGFAGVMYQQIDRHHPLRPGLPARAHRLHRRGARRHREPHRRGPGRRAHRPHPGAQRRCRRTASASSGRQTVVFSILILLMVFKPEGILGKPTVEKV